MNIKIKNTANTLACTLQYDQKLRFICPIPCKYGTETIAYAAARFIRHCPDVRDHLIRKAVAAGLDVGRRVKPAHIHIHTTARNLSLPGESAYINVVVTPGTVSIKSVRIECSSDCGGKSCRRIA